MSQGRSGSTRTRRTRPEACARRYGAPDGWAPARRGTRASAGARVCRRGRRPRRRGLGATRARSGDRAPRRPTSLRSGGRGQLLPDWYEDWVEIERERLRELRSHALEALCHRLTTAGRFGEATEAGLAAVRDEPLRESAHRVLIGVHLAEGNRAAALHQYRAFALLLHEEVGMSPTSRMEQLMESITAR